MDGMYYRDNLSFGRPFDKSGKTGCYVLGSTNDRPTVIYRIRERRGHTRVTCMRCYLQSVGCPPCICSMSLSLSSHPSQ
jgi:hypothetical protein